MQSFGKTLAAIALMVGALAAPLSPALAQSHARDPQAEQFVAAGGKAILAILNDKHRSVVEKRQAFREEVDQLVDVPRITHFVLGKYARSATPDQYRRFAETFRTYAEKEYQARLDDYHGEKFTVTGSVVHKPGDVTVETALSGGGLSQPAVVVWRVLGTGPSARLIDVQVKGVWLAITEQQDFVSTIDNAGGNIDVLIAQLVRDAQKIGTHK